MSPHKGFIDVNTGIEDKWEKAKVNWFRNGKMGITYLEKDNDPGNDLSNVVEVEEDTVRFSYGEIGESEQKKDVREEDTSDLKSRLKKLRRERSEKNEKRKKKKKSKGKSKKKSSKKSEKDEEEELKEDLKNMSEEKKEQLKDLLKEGED